MAESLGSQASDAGDKAASDVEKAAPAAADDVKKAAGNVANAAGDAANQAEDAAEGAVDAAKSTVSGAAKPAGDAASAATGAQKQTTTGAGTAAKTAATGASAAAAASGTTAKAAPAGAKPTVAGSKPAATGAAKPAGATGVPAGVKPAGAAARPAGAKEETPVAAPPKGITRREFLNYVWGASIALFLVQFGGITFFFAMPRFRAGEFGGTISVPIDSIPQTNAAPVANNSGKFWLVQTDAGINTLYKICTHLGCIYPWNEAAGIFACPCHGSQFQLNGDWIAGPAARSLDKFAFDVLDSNGTVLVSVTDGNAVPMPAGASTVVVNTGLKVLGQSHF